MREEVTMVIGDMSYLELCLAFKAYRHTKTNTESRVNPSTAIRREGREMNVYAEIKTLKGILTRWRLFCEV